MTYYSGEDMIGDDGFGTTEHAEKNELFAWYAGEKFLAVKKSILTLFGCETGIFLSLLINWRNYLENENKLPKDKYFYLEKQNIQDQTGIGLKKQTKIINLLEKYGILKINRKGIPRKNWYLVDMFKLAKLMKSQTPSHRGQIDATGKVKSTQLERSNRRNYINNTNKKENKVKENNISFSKEKEREFSRKTRLTSKISKNSKMGFFETNNQKPSNQKPSIATELLQYWNSIDNPNIPKHIRQNTKTQEQIKTYIVQLINGRFGQGKKFKPGFFHDYNIPSKWIDTQITPDQIKDAMDRLQLLYLEGYEPRDKSYLPKSLPALFFNPGAKSMSSWFLRVLANKPVRVENKPKGKFKPKSDGEPFPVDLEVNERTPGDDRFPVDAYIDSYE